MHSRDYEQLTAAMAKRLVESTTGEHALAVIHDTKLHGRITDYQIDVLVETASSLCVFECKHRSRAVDGDTVRSFLLLCEDVQATTEKRVRGYLVSVSGFQTSAIRWKERYNTLLPGSNVYLTFFIVDSEPGNDVVSVFSNIGQTKEHRHRYHLLYRPVCHAARGYMTKKDAFAELDELIQARESSDFPRAFTKALRLLVELETGTVPEEVMLGCFDTLCTIEIIRGRPREAAHYNRRAACMLASYPDLFGANERYQNTAQRFAVKRLQHHSRRTILNGLQRHVLNNVKPAEMNLPDGAISGLYDFAWTVSEQGDADAIEIIHRANAAVAHCSNPYFGWMGPIKELSVYINLGLHDRAAVTLDACRTAVSCSYTPAVFQLLLQTARFYEAIGDRESACTYGMRARALAQKAFYRSDDLGRLIRAVQNDG